MNLVQKCVWYGDNRENSRISHLVILTRQASTIMFSKIFQLEPLSIKALGEW
jgi:hypothetical protein